MVLRLPSSEHGYHHILVCSAVASIHNLRIWYDLGMINVAALNLRIPSSTILRLDP